MTTSSDLRTIIELGDLIEFGCYLAQCDHRQINALRRRDLPEGFHEALLQEERARTWHPTYVAHVKRRLGL